MTRRKIAVIGGGISGLTGGHMLPARSAVRASWNYSLSCRGPGAARAGIGYHLNRLRGLPPGTDYIVTLGGQRGIDPARVVAARQYAHPAYTRESVAPQELLPGLNTSVTAFAGAYHGRGFHEDGCRSGMAAARALGGAW